MTKLEPSETAGFPPSVRPRTGSVLVAEALHQCGITRLIGITGTPVDRVFPACAAQGIRLIGARRQQAALGCAEQFVTDVADLRPSLERAAASPLPTCINVRVDPHAAHPGSW